jgi:TonB family protein
MPNNSAHFSLDLVMRDTILCLIAIAFGSVFSLRSALGAERERVLAIYTPAPKYPSLPNGQRPEGTGVFICHVDFKSGLVTSVSVEKSTGFAILDNAAIESYRRWKFKPGTVRRVKIPLTFTTHGLPPI